MLPKGWSATTLGEVFSFKNGLNGEKSLYGSGTKFVNVMDVFRGPRLKMKDIAGKMEVSGKQLSEYSVNYGDVLFNRTSETDDEIALSTTYLDTAPAVFGGFVIRARPIGKTLSAEFSVYCFQSAGMRRAMIRLGQGAIRSNIGQGDLRTVPIDLPPLPEQQGIAEILSTWDRAIETVEKLIANARAQKKALMQDLLTGKKRLPGFSEEWVNLSFDSLFKVKNDKNAQVQKTQYQLTGPTPIVDQGQDLIVAYTSHSRVYDAVPVIVFGDHTRVIKWIDFSFCPGADGTQLLKATDKLDLAFGYQLLLHAPIPNLGYSRHMRELKEISFDVPQNLLEQRKIAEILTVNDLEIRRLENLLAMTQVEKSSLMQQLLTGKRRVNLRATAA